MTLPPLEHIVYGPVRSRRLGASLGINLLPPGLKVCNMNCAYCQYGWTRERGRVRGRGTPWPTPQAIEAAVSERLSRAAAGNELIDRITVAGHGEPTLHPEFEEVTDRRRAIIDRFAPGLPLAILSNSTTTRWPDVRRALGVYDERYMKLDAGDPITYARINGPGEPIENIVQHLAMLPSIVVQAMFVTDAAHDHDNSTDGAVAAWLAAVERLHALRVHIYTIDRTPALAGLQPVARRQLRLEAPKTLNLRFGQPQTGHLEILGLNESKTIVRDGLLRCHRRSSCGSRRDTWTRAIDMPRCIAGNPRRFPRVLIRSAGADRD